MAFGGASVIRDLSLQLAAGDMRCIIGPNGCGKTTLFNIITGAFPPTAGDVFLGGERVTGRQAFQIARRGASRKFQVPGVYPELTVSENLEVPLAVRSGTSALSAAFARPSVARQHELLELCGLAGRQETTVATLSHGEKQWLEIAMLLATDASLLLLDEPTAGMTIAETEKTGDMIKRLRADFGKTVLVIEHDMTFVRQLECPVMVMMNGTILREGSYEEVRADPRVIDAYLGEGVLTC